MEDSIKTQIVPLHAVPSADCQSSVQAPLVLIVDDERIIADTVSAILKRAGYRTLCAYGGRKALELALEHAPDLLISDVLMPDLDGASLALQIAESVPHCRILLVSGHAAVSHFDLPCQTGIDFRLLPKPVHPSVLLREIEETLGSSVEDRSAPRSERVPADLRQIA